MAPPNIVLIITDQQARATFGAYGNERTHAPNMDALAEGGVAFERSYCASPVCSPGRASILTGYMPHTTGVNVNDVPLREAIRTIGETFRDAGYDTAWSGKWNLPDSFPKGADETQGFRNLSWQRGIYRDLGASMDEDIASEAVRYLGGDREEPFFLGVSLYNPHDICFWIMDRDHDVLPEIPDDANLPELPQNFDPKTPEPEFVGMLRQRERELPGVGGDLYGWTEIRWTDDWDERHWRRYLYMYDRLVELVDVQIGRVLDALRENGLHDDTLVVLTSDHGEGIAAHRWVTKEMLYEEPAGVPLVIHWPRGIPTRALDSIHLASSIDIAPTLFDYAGISAPPDLPGRSLRPVIDDPSRAGRDFVVTELNPDPFRLELQGRMVRTMRYKYIVFNAGADPQMLFDLQEDPLEMTDLASSRDHERILDEHRGLLHSWSLRTADEFEAGSALL